MKQISAFVLFAEKSRDFVSNLHKRELSFFSEVGEAESLRRLVFLAVTDAGENKHDYRYHVGKHFENFLAGEAYAGDIAAGDVESTEDKRAENSQMGLPHGEDNQSDGQPADGIDAVFPVTVKVVHNEGKTAEACDGAADTGGGITVA